MGLFDISSTSLTEWHSEVKQLILKKAHDFRFPFLSHLHSVLSPCDQTSANAQPLTSCSHPLLPLDWQSAIRLKARSLPLLTPALTLDHTSKQRRHKDPDAETKRLKRNYKSEMKGAVKALKKDARELAIHKRANFVGSKRKTDFRVIKQ